MATHNSFVIRLNETIVDWVKDHLNDTIITFEKEWEEGDERQELEEFLNDFIGDFGCADDFSNFYYDAYRLFPPWSFYSLSEIEVATLEIRRLLLEWIDTLSIWDHEYKKTKKEGLESLKVLINTYAYYYVGDHFNWKDESLIKMLEKSFLFSKKYPVIPNYPHSCVVCFETKELFGFCSVCVSGKVCMECAGRLDLANGVCPVCRQSFIAEMYGKPDSNAFVDWDLKKSHVKVQLKETLGMMAEDKII